MKLSQRSHADTEWMSEERIMYLLGSVEYVENFILILTIFTQVSVRSLEAINFVQQLVLWGHMFCPLSGDREVVHLSEVEMYCFYGKNNVYCMGAVCISESLLWEVPL